MRLFYYQREGELFEESIPDAENEVLPGVRWGEPETPFTPAYWLTQFWMRNPPQPQSMRIGASFREEVIACLLGGYGIPAEVGVAAFHRLRERRLIDSGSGDEEKISKALRDPMMLNGRSVRYRFWAQKAAYVSRALTYLSKSDPPSRSAGELRCYLLCIPGIGPKTASWIVRNWLDSDDVAILDIHIIRACTEMGLFSENDRVTSHYFEMEGRFLQFASAVGVPARLLDALIWAQMKYFRQPTSKPHTKNLRSNGDSLVLFGQLPLE